MIRYINQHNEEIIWLILGPVAHASWVRFDIATKLRNYNIIIFFYQHSFTISCALYYNWFIAAFGVHCTFVIYIIYDITNLLKLNKLINKTHVISDYYIHINALCLDTLNFTESDLIFWIITLSFSDFVSLLSETDDVMSQCNVYCGNHQLRHGRIRIHKKYISLNVCIFWYLKYRC
jgi:hypothetical protein